MKRCSSCNYQCEDYRTICPKCGKPLSANAYIGPGGNAPAMRNNAPSGGAQQPRGGARYGYITPYDHTMEFSIEEISGGKPFAMFNYLLGWLGIVACLMRRNNPYVQFHVRENLKYLVTEAVVDVIMLVFAGFFSLLAIVVRDGRYVYDYGPNIGLMRVSGFFIAMAVLFTLVVTVFQFISFVQVCRGKATEALVVRHFGFMR